MSELEQQSQPTSEPKANDTPKPRRAFVAGATGPTGRAVVQTLVNINVETIAHVRPDQIDLDGWVEWFHDQQAQVDLTAWKQDRMSETLDRLKPDYVFVTLGSSPERIGRGRDSANPFVDSYKAVDYGLTAMLVRAASSCGSRPHIIFTSATRAREGAGEFLDAKWKSEEFIRKSGLPHSIIRIERILDTEVNPRPTPGLFGSARELLHERKRRADSMTTVELAEVLVACALDKTFRNRTLDPEQYV